MECVLQQTSEGKWWCPKCDPDQCRLLKLRVHRNCRNAAPIIPVVAKQKYLGDRVEQALGSVGVTEKRVSKWLGRSCGCEEKREKLNQLDRWARRKLKGLFGSDKEAEADLEDILRQ